MYNPLFLHRLRDPLLLDVLLPLLLDDLLPHLLLLLLQPDGQSHSSNSLLPGLRLDKNKSLYFADHKFLSNKALRRHFQLVLVEDLELGLNMSPDQHLAASSNHPQGETNFQEDFHDKEIKICLVNNLETVDHKQVLRQNKNKLFKKLFLSCLKVLEEEEEAVIFLDNKERLRCSKHNKGNFPIFHCNDHK